ncbi:TonB-dependent receptor [Galbibacter sp. EGI 63066]|uniref:TonB-dependent receptor n=1 Tax=Galbibacter sp. EGI 63066 TaxID=2993559 RepID=UPI002248EEBA|nr:TonB-dependent receptor [Galbibacter sp. EGI 63066]MCX2682050.1 TonB-dependent receptor [Galbibacter sp. EGI 63066]
MKQLFLLVLLLISLVSFSQEDTTILKNPSLQEVFSAIESKSEYKFAYDNKLNTKEKVGFDIRFRTEEIDTVIEYLKKNSKYNINKLGKNITITKKQADRKHTFSGKVLDENNEPLLGANIYIEEEQTGTMTDHNGLFSIKLPEGSYTVRISYIGFLNAEETIELYQNINKKYILFDSGQKLDEVIITQKNNIAEIRKPQMSLNRLSAEQIKGMPLVLGETDPLKALLQLPGVTNAGEGSSGFNVRGGAADQNLILLDGSPIFSDSHLFGFFSVFNADALSGLKLYKGGIPSKYGGRVSSVLDARQKTGDLQDFHMNGGIGLISSRLLAEGPITKGKGSYLIAGRSSYAHLFLKLANNDNSAYFYDLNSKLNYKLNENNSLFVSGYYGRDFFEISDNFSSTYGNAMLNLRWNHHFSDDITSNLSTFYSDYNFKLDLGILDFSWKSTIGSAGLRYDFSHHFSDNLSLQYGANAIYYDFNPGTLEPDEGSARVNYRQLDKKYALEPSFYIDAEHKLSENLTLQYGLRFSMFYRYGKEEINHYENDQAVVFNPDFQIYEKGTPTGTTLYESGKTISNFNNFEPRIGLSYALNDNTSIKASYNRMTQYIHLLANNQSPSPVNVWTPSGPFIEPQLLDQSAIGFFKNFKNNTYTIETEVFYKTVKNRIDYVDGANLIANDDIEQVILNGKARSYGWEILLQKNTGKLTGWIAYTLSRAEQKTPGRTPQETGIANGEWYLSTYDKLHDLSVTGNYKLSNKWSFGGNFTFQTGRPGTFPNSQYEFDNIRIPNYSSRNESRLPVYHHLDLSATYTPKPKSEKKWKGEWVFSIYNVYNRKNSASITFESNKDTGANEAIRLSIFGIIPSISYNFKF